MHTAHYLGFAILLCASSAQAVQTLAFPKAEPLITFTAPDDWKPQIKGESLFVVSPDGGDVIVEVMTMEAPAGDLPAALAEAKGTVSEDFKGLKLKKVGPGESNGLTVTLYGGEGTDSSGAAMINMAILQAPGAEHPILFSLIANKEKTAENGPACGEMMDSISAADAPAAESQTFGYPNTEKPAFSVDLPAEWPMEKNKNDGVYVQSDDKLVAFNVLIIDKAELPTATAAMKQSVGERFKTINWNQGKEPEVTTDDASGVTATFNNAVAHDGEGTPKYSVNLVGYAPKAGDKTMLVLVQTPIKALDKHEKAIKGVMESINIR